MFISEAWAQTAETAAPVIVPETFALTDESKYFPTVREELITYDPFK